MSAIDRRDFLKNLGGSIVTGAAAWQALQAIVPARADELPITPGIVQFRPEMEDVVRWIEKTPRERILDEAVERLKKGLPYRQLVGGLFLAGILNIKPRPVGFKFHAVMAISSAHQLALDTPQADRLLPFFWALDNFKSAQAHCRDDPSVRSFAAADHFPPHIFGQLLRMGQTAGEKWTAKEGAQTLPGHHHFRQQPSLTQT